MITNSNPKNLNNSSSENFKSESLPIGERVSLLDGNSFSFGVNKFYNLINNESLC